MSHMMSPSDISACKRFNSEVNSVSLQYGHPGPPWFRSYSFIHNPPNVSANVSANPTSFCYTKTLLTKHEKLMNKKNIIFSAANNSNTNYSKLSKVQQYVRVAKGFSANGHRNITYASQNDTSTNPNSYGRHKPHTNSIHICPCEDDHSSLEYCSYNDNFPPWPGPAE